jgi:hypothetical protein
MLSVDQADNHRLDVLSTLQGPQRNRNRETL